MKLKELFPRWLGTETVIYGLSFQCPHCKAQRLAIYFTPVVGPSQPVLEGSIWQRTPPDTHSASFDTITLKPSIDTSFHGHWHGWIENGEIK